MTAGVTASEGAWHTPDGRRLSYRLWRPPAVRALVVLIHGFGEHGGRYGPVAAALAGQGIAVAAPDLWGHGRSGGARGDTQRVSRCVEDCTALTQAVFLRWAGCSTYVLYGHSFGGLAAIHWLLRRPDALRRAVIQSPLLEVGFPLPAAKVFLARVAARVWPSLRVPLNLEVTHLSHDPDVVRAYQRDPLVHNAMSVRTYFDLLQARQDALTRAAEVGTPVLLLLGGDDRIISVPVAQRWFERVPGEKAQRLYPGAYHELHHEPVREQVLQEVAAWALSGAGASAGRQET